MAKNYQHEYAWAKAHPDHALGQEMLSLAQIYAARPDHCALALIDAVAERIRALPSPAPNEGNDGR